MHCQNGEVPVGLWHCEDLQADTTAAAAAAVDTDDDGDDWSILTGVGYLLQSRHAACFTSAEQAVPSVLLLLAKIFSLAFLLPTSHSVHHYLSQFGGEFTAEILG